MSLTWLGLCSLTSFSAASLAVAPPVGALAAPAETMTIEEFQEYLNAKLPQLSAKDSERIALLVDVNDDGEIDDDEFANRMKFVGKIMSEGRAPERAAEPVAMADYMDGEAVIVSSLTEGGGAELLLITGGSLAEAWVPFAEWKTRQGRATKIMTVRQIARLFGGPSIQEKIRLCVNEHIEKHGTRFVLLGGDCIPGGGVVPGGPMTFHEMEPQGIPTDLIYVSPTNWDADGDGVSGEWKDDAEAITYPDGRVAIGRVPVRTVEDVAAYTAKVVSYESEYPTTGFADQMLFTSADENSSLKVKRAWDSYICLAWNGSAKRLFVGEMPGGEPSDEAGEASTTTLSADSLIEAFNARESGKMHIHGHGHLDQWVLEGSMFQAKHVRRLDNEGAYPVVTTVSCNTGEYDSESDPSIVESVIRAPLAGAMAVVAPIREGKMHFLDKSDYGLMLSEGKLDGSTMLLTRFWIHAAGEEHSTGHALAAARADLAAEAKKHAGFHLCISEFNLLGDPTLAIHSGAPMTPEITSSSGARLGPGRLHFVTNAPGATLCVWKGLEAFETIILDGQGCGEVAVDIKTAGELEVTISGVGLNVVTKTLSVK